MRKNIPEGLLLEVGKEVESTRHLCFLAVKRYFI